MIGYGLMMLAVMAPGAYAVIGGALTDRARFWRVARSRRLRRHPADGRRVPGRAGAELGHAAPVHVHDTACTAACAALWLLRSG